MEIGRTGREEGLKTRGLHGERKSDGKGSGGGTQQREKSPSISHRGSRWKKGESLFSFPRKREVICGVLARIQDSGKEGQRTQAESALHDPPPDWQTGFRHANARGPFDRSRRAKMAQCRPPEKEGLGEVAGLFSVCPRSPFAKLVQRESS